MFAYPRIKKNLLFERAAILDQLAKLLEIDLDQDLSSLRQRAINQQYLEVPNYSLDECISEIKLYQSDSDSDYAFELVKRIRELAPGDWRKICSHCPDIISAIEEKTLAEFCLSAKH